MNAASRSLSLRKVVVRSAMEFQKNMPTIRVAQVGNLRASSEPRPQINNLRHKAGSYKKSKGFSFPKPFPMKTGQIDLAFDFLDAGIEFKLEHALVDCLVLGDVRQTHCG